MTKEISETQLKEIEEIKDWCTSILEFIAKVGESDSFTGSMIDIVNKLYSKRDRKRLFTMYNDLNESTKGLSTKDYLELNSILQEKFGKNLEFTDKKNSIFIKKIIKKGKIVNDEEYRIIEAQVDELCQMNPSSHEIEILNNLLISFHNS